MVLLIEALVHYSPVFEPVLASVNAKTLRNPFCLEYSKPVERSKRILDPKTPLRPSTILALNELERILAKGSRPKYFRIMYTALLCAVGP